MKKIILLLIWLSVAFTIDAAHQPSFSTAGFYSLPETGRQVYSMNPAWRFNKSDVLNAEDKSFDDTKWEVVSVPHGLEYLPVDASGGVNYQGVAWYRKHFTADTALKEKKLFLHFEAIMGKCKIWINDELLTEHFGGYLPVITDISDKVNWESDNVIAVRADNSNDPLYLPGKAQNMLDYSYFGGIYRDCWLVAHNEVFITDPNYENEVAGGGLFVSYDKVSDKHALLNLKLQVRNSQKENFTGTVEYELIQADGKIVKKVSDNIQIGKENASYSSKQIAVANPKLWCPEAPYLYQLAIRIKDSKGKVIDGYMHRVGIRSIEFKQKDGLWLNGKRYEQPLIGVNRHQDFAVIGNALPNSLHWRDAKKLRDAGSKVIRGGNYPMDPAFMDACDELGLFVLVNTPGWQFWNDKPIFGERAYQDIRNLVRQNRNHPSLFFWEPILNETSYPTTFARKAKEVVEAEYPYPYSAIACDDGADGSEYFSLLLRPRQILDPDKTYFVREWGDNVDDWNAQNSDSRVNRGWGEVPMLVQAWHYASPDQNVICLESLYQNPRHIVGGCLWHSFDHQRGYHPVPFLGGIMDAYRQPKYSYYMFKAQREPVKADLIAETGPMVYIAHEMTPFSPKDVTVYSNCDEVRLSFLKDGKKQVYKKDPKHKGMPSPILTFNDMFNFMTCKRMARENKQKDIYLLAEGLINGEVVATHKVVPSRRPEKVVLWLDNENVDLTADGSDVVTVIAGIADKEGNIKRLSNDYIQFSIEGEGRILGGADVMQNPRQVSWGTAPAMVQSTTQAGEIKITASVLFEGSQMPVSGSLIINSQASNRPAIYHKSDANRIIKQAVQSTRRSYNKSGLEAENERLRKELNDLKLKEVERQQTKFGVGIN